ncbi:glutamate receptor 2.9 [Arachis duranensis]|uniref:Glutamate receptor 2.9 n=1 Tax=Arachis duranensis TaxID=130453 RepID=A0A9C6TQR6_ARADU|nr:glutamate receptor 2.9-like [Arachis hypogaea]XP_052114792.1 glutamate receptor 2.9 [Arachis duranensis]
MVEGLFRCNRIDDAFILLEEVINKGIKLPYRKFDSFLMQLSTIGDLHAIHRLSDHMRKFYNHAMARRYALSQKRSFVHEILKDLGFHENQLKIYKSAEECNDLFTKGSANDGIDAAFDEVPFVMHLLGTYCSKYVMVEPRFKTGGFGFTI